MAMNDYRRVIDEEHHLCPNCSNCLNFGIDIGDGYLYDLCPGCGYKRKTLDGKVVGDGNCNKEA